MKTRMVCLFLFILLVISSCGESSTQSSPLATTAASITEISKAQQVVDEINDKLNGSSFSLAYSEDDNTFYFYGLGEGTALGVAGAKADIDDYDDAWKELKNAFTELCGTVKSRIEEKGIDDPLLVGYILDDTDHSKSVFTVVNGEVTYDAGFHYKNTIPHRGIPDESEIDEAIYSVIPGSTHEVEITTTETIVRLYTNFLLDQKPNNWDEIKAAVVEAYENDPVVTKVTVYDKSGILLLVASENKLMDQYEVSAEKAAERAAKENEYKGVYILNTSTKVFHKETCGRVDSIAASHKSYSAKSASALQQEGYAPCKICN